jgi:hypothetical protein
LEPVSTRGRITSSEWISAVREVPFLVSSGGVRLFIRWYFCYVLVSIGWTALAGEKLGEGRLAAADCLDPGRYCPFDRGRNSKSVCLKAGLLGWCVLQLCGTVTVPYGRGVHSAQIHIHALDADKMVSTDPS